MIKQIAITFDFNTETEEVTNIKTVGSEVKAKKTTTTKKLKEAVEEMASESLITLESNKLVFNNKAVVDMELEYEQRIVIEYKKSGRVMSPIIRKDEEAGNKVTKSNTVTYKGKANTVLAEFGSEFTLEPLSEGVWKLVSKTPKKEVSNEQSPTPSFSLEDVISQAEATEPDLLVESDETTQIDEFTFKL